MPRVVSCFARAVDFDALRMISSGTLVATVPPERVGKVRQALKQVGTAFAFMGRVTEGPVCGCSEMASPSTTRRFTAKKTNWPECGASTRGTRSPALTRI